MTTFANTGLRYTTPLSIESQERVFRADSLSLKVQAVTNGSQRWAMEFGLETTSMGGATNQNGLLSVHRSKYGQHTSFKTPMPQHLGTAPPTANATIRVRPTPAAAAYSGTTSYAVGDTVIQSGARYRVIQAGRGIPVTNTAYFTPFSIPTRTAGTNSLYVGSSVASTLSIGRFFTFAGLDKVFQLLEAIPTGNSGSARQTYIEFFPPLPADLAVNDVALDFSPDVTAYYAQDGRFGLEYTRGILQAATISLVEAT